MFRLEMWTGNDAFAYGTPEEVATYLRAIADKLEAGVWSAPVRDVNGNTIGEYSLEVEEDTAKAEAQARWLEREARDELDLY